MRLTMARAQVYEETVVRERIAIQTSCSACLACRKYLRRRRLIDEHPKHADLPDGFAELLKVNRLLRVGAYSQVVALDQILLLFRRGENNDRDLLRALVGADGPQHPQAIDFGKFQIK